MIMKASKHFKARSEAECCAALPKNAGGSSNGRTTGSGPV